MTSLSRCTTAFVACLATSSLGASPGRAEVPVIVVSPYIVATPIARAGSTVSVISREQLERSSAGTVAELLRHAPGVTVTERGGAGGQALVSLRGAEAGHTLVLIDGLRVNDPASARADFDFAQLSLTAVERIEILKGPQSALYGSDAIGGVINIITRRPTNAVRASATVEGGSYGTRRASGTLSGGRGDFRALLSGTYFASSGFSRVGDRDAGEKDGTEKIAGTFRGTYTGLTGVVIDVGVDAHNQVSDIDASSKPSGDLAGYTSARSLVNGFARARFDSAGGRIGNTITVFAARSTRRFEEPSEITFYRGGSSGVEYQGHIKRVGRGDLLVGLRAENESAYKMSVPGVTPDFDTARTLYAGYFVYQLPLDALNLSFAGRHDGEIGGVGFTPGRVTGVYELAEQEARIRASLGTGAKRPTAFQFSYNTGLSPELSVGADLGVEKTMFDGRLTASVTGFWNRFTNLIDWDFPAGTYKNVAEAETAGVEVAIRKRIIPGKLSATAAYTFLHSRDLATGLPLQRRPMHSGKVSATYTGIDRLEATVSATFVGARSNNDSGTVMLAPYTRVDATASYRLNDQTELFARIENLFNATYHEATGYNAAGLSAYAGLNWRN
ncbi:MAG: TonB-dependent receptor plug domain-containing protein [Alphaproteobacteria bacterium]